MSLTKKFPELTISTYKELPDNLLLEVVDTQQLSCRRETGDLDPTAPVVQQLYQWVAPAMLWYVHPEKVWDPHEIAQITIGDTEKCAIIWSPETNQPEGVLSFTVEPFENEQVLTHTAIVVNPQRRGKGLAQHLWQAAVNQRQVDMVAGSTNSEVAALARAKVLLKLGFSTWVGNQLIHRHQATNLDTCQQLFADWLAHKKYAVSDTDLPYRTAAFTKFKETDRAVRKPADVDTENWAALQKVFDEVLVLQEIFAQSLVQVPLVSIKK